MVQWNEKPGYSTSLGQAMSCDLYDDAEVFSIGRCQLHIDGLLPSARPQHRFILVCGPR